MGGGSYISHALKVFQGKVMSEFIYRFQLCLYRDFKKLEAVQSKILRFGIPQNIAGLVT